MWLKYSAHDKLPSLGSPCCAEGAAGGLWCSSFPRHTGTPLQVCVQGLREEQSWCHLCGAQWDLQGWAEDGSWDASSCPLGKPHPRLRGSPTAWSPQLSSPGWQFGWDCACLSWWAVHSTSVPWDPRHCRSCSLGAETWAQEVQGAWV